ncbi:PQ loop repeat-domain-containing protein [Pilobolus umbonatus]|nr:PQ loop repeat-domain-containing protein [Pilobolus umbonatus]
MTICLPTEEGVPYVQWINSLFGDCVYGTQDAVSLLLGYASILCWLNAQLPQVIENYKMGSADGLSFNFLSIWLAGDTANLIGAVLTHQLPFQLYLGIYFVLIDVCLVFQWIYYNKLGTKHDEYIIVPAAHHDPVSFKPSNHLFQHPAHVPVTINAAINQLHDELTPFSSSASPSKWYTLSSKNEDHFIPSNKTNENRLKSTYMAILLFTFSSLPSSTLTTANSTHLIDQDNVLWIGRVFAWTCTCLYLSSRIPQLLKNRRRQSVEGLSISLFIFAACGNMTYASSILSHPGQTTDSILEALPYLIGSAGTLIFDFSIFCQFLCYRKHPVISVSNKQLDTAVVV